MQCLILEILIISVLSNDTKKLFYITWLDGTLQDSERFSGCDSTKYTLVHYYYNTYSNPDRLYFFLKMASSVMVKRTSYQYNCEIIKAQQQNA